MGLKFLQDIVNLDNIQFINSSGTNAGLINMDGNDLVISNSQGDVLLGDGSADVFIGDGTNNVDIRFEQSGSITADNASATLTIGGTGNLVVEEPTINNPTFSGSLNIGAKLTLSTSNGYILFDYEPAGDTGEYTTEVPLLKVDQNGTEKTILSRISENGGIQLGHDDTILITAGDTGDEVKANWGATNENVVLASEAGFYALAFPNNSTTWSNRNIFRFYGGSATATENGLYIGDGSSTQFIDLDRNISAASVIAGNIKAMGGGNLFVYDDDDDTKIHFYASSNATEGFLQLSNGSNWGLLARGKDNGPRLGAYHNGYLSIWGFGSNTGADHADDDELAKFDFANERFDVNGEIRGDGLDIDGNADISGNLTINSTYPRIFLTDSNHNDDWSIINNDGKFGIYNDTDTSYALTVDGSNNVGIGQTSPAQKLDVAGYIRSGNTGADSTTKYSGFFGRHYTNSEEDVLAISTESTSNNNNIYIGGGFGTRNSATTIRFSTAANNTTTTGTERMRIDSSGNVGIGTATPSEKLEVSGKAIIRKSGSATAHADTDLLVTDATATSSTAAIEILGGNAGHSNIKFADADSYTSGSIDYSHSSNSMTFRTNGSQNVTIDSSGNVGIGTTNPSEKLEVDGNIAVSGTVDGRDIATDGTKLDTISTNADVTPSWVPSSDPSYLTSLPSHNHDDRYYTETESDARYAALSHNHAASSIVTGTLADGRISESSVTQHEAALTITEGQLPDDMPSDKVKQICTSHHNFFMNSSSTTADFFVPFNNLNESSNPTNAQYYNRMVAPYNGRIVKVVLNTTAAIGTSCQVLFWVANSTSGVFAPSASETVTGVNLNTQNSHAVATFSTTSTAEFNEGDVLGVSIIKSSSATANIQVTVVWEYTV